MNYEDYDGYRYEVEVVRNMLLYIWFEELLDEDEMEIMVNSYYY